MVAEAASPSPFELSRGSRNGQSALVAVQLPVLNGRRRPGNLLDMAEEWEQVRGALRDAGVSGVEDLGRFVNKTQYFEPSRLDEAAAAPVLLRLLPELDDERVVRTIGRHLQSKAVPRGCYDKVLAAYQKWGRRPGEAGWVLGDTLARKADKSHADDFVALASDPSYGTARAFIDDALWRFKSVADVEPLLHGLIRDPDVSAHAMSALQRTIGPERMATALRDLLNETVDDRVADQARRQLKRVERKLKLRS